MHVAFVGQLKLWSFVQGLVPLYLRHAHMVKLYRITRYEFDEEKKRNTVWRASSRRGGLDVPGRTL